MAEKCAGECKIVRLRAIMEQEQLLVRPPLSITGKVDTKFAKLHVTRHIQVGGDVDAMLHASCNKSVELGETGRIGDCGVPASLH